MAKTRKRTKAHKASDAAFSGLMAVVMAVGAALVFLFIILSNVFSLSTMADFGVRQYVDNVTSLHMSQTFQTVRPMLAYEKPRYSLVEAHEKIATVPDGALFRFRGDLEVGNKRWVAFEAYHGSRRVTGYLLTSEAPETTPGSSGYFGIRDVDNYDDVQMPRQSALVNYPRYASDGSPLGSVRKNFLQPALRADLEAVLDLKRVNGEFQAEALRENDAYFEAKALRNGTTYYFAPKEQKTRYKNVVEKFEDVEYMALYQIEPGFDVLRAIRNGEKPEEGNWPLWMIAVALLVAWHLFRWFAGMGKVKCPECGAKSKEHEVLDQQSYQGYKHQTKTGKPDLRYKKNPLIKWTVVTHACTECGEQFAREL